MSKQLSGAFITANTIEYATSKKWALAYFWYDEKHGVSTWQSLQKYDRVFYVASPEDNRDTFQNMRTAALLQSIHIQLLQLPGCDFRYFVEKMFATPKEIIAAFEQLVLETFSEVVCLKPRTSTKPTQHTSNGNSSNSSSGNTTKLAFSTLNDFYDLIVPEKELSPAEIAVAGFIFRHLDWRTGEAHISISRIAEPMKKSDRYIKGVVDSLISKRVFAKARGYGRTVNAYTPLLLTGSFMAGVNTHKYKIISTHK